MGTLTPDETVREHNRGRKAAGDGRSRYWSEPWAYPFESELESNYVIMIVESQIQTNRVERSMNDTFCAFWHGQMAYENGRVKRFKTEHAAWEFLARCDAAGKIIH
jgi:uncharacterized protein (DUF427 family)